MQNIILLAFCFLFLSACNSSFQIISKTKQIVYPGRHTENIYINYILKFSLNTTNINTIDSIHVLKEKQLYKVVNYFIKKEKSASYSKNINQKGNYILEIPIKKNNISSIDDFKKNEKSEVIIYYQNQGISKSIYINDFIEERKTRR